jgi:hypothetical protein
MEIEIETSLQQKMARLLAEMKASYAEMEARAEARQERADARQEKANAEMKAVQDEMKAAYVEMEARAEARHERFLARLDGLTSYGKGTTTWQTTSSSEEMDATRLVATLEETEAAVERQKLIENEINAENIGSSEDRYGEKRLAARRRRGAKKRSQDSVGSLQKVSAARKRVIRRAVPAVRKGNIRKYPGRNSAGRVHSKSRTFGKKQRLRSEYNKRINCRESRQQARLRMKRTSDMCHRTPMQLGEENRIVSSTIELQDVIYWTFWKVLPPPTRKKELRTVRRPEALKQRSLQY